MEQIYLDNSATTKPTKKVIAAVNYALETAWHNPSSLYLKGMEAESIIKKARHTAAQFIKAKDDEIFFMSSGTEGNNTAIFTGVEARKKRGNRIVTTTIEHPSVKNPIKKLEKLGYEVVWLAPNQEGKIPIESIRDAINDKTILVSIMYVNNETGAIQPIDKIRDIIKDSGAPAIFHTDAVQAFGKLDIDVGRLGVDLLTASGHKIHAPKGIGMLYCSKTLHLEPFILGGGQEKGFRSGTENVPFIAGFKEAIDEIDINENRKSVLEVAKYAKLRLRELEGIEFNSPDDALEYIINFSLVGYRSEILLHFLESEGILVSSGSACSKGATSSVLREMGKSQAVYDSALRISLSRYTLAEDFDKLLEALKKAMQKLKRVR